ncbi:hypothetical protein [Paraburkholderia sp. MM6662-R1]|uniref:hypothetical protein n=1 Tax=Paraburkholderia sp. MM6662-R1 TaxID=2991066 RepID=UPI003D25EAC5
MLTKHSRLVRAIVHLVANAPTQPQSTDIDTELDVVLNRIIDAELVGVRHDCLRLVVQVDAQMTEYPIIFNALDLARPGNPEKRRAPTADQPIHIRSLDVVGGSVAFYVDREGGKPVSAGIAGMLR